MANYSARLAKHATTGINVSDTITLIQDAMSVEVVNRSTNELYVRTDGAIPTVAGDDCEVLPSGASLLLPTPQSTTVVSVISAAASNYSVVVR